MMKILKFGEKMILYYSKKIEVRYLRVFKPGNGQV